jgi:hypothetical protein
MNQSILESLCTLRDHLNLKHSSYLVELSTEDYKDFEEFKKYQEFKKQ